MPEVKVENELEKLRAFYKAVAKLTSDHASVEIDALDIHVAVVFPRDLGKELAKVYPEWWKNHA